MIIRVKTIWQGKVGIHEKYIQQAYGNGPDKKFDDILIKHGEEVMTIPCLEIKKKIVGKSDIPFQDRYSMESYWLYYFEWKPDPKPATLFDQ